MEKMKKKRYEKMKEKRMQEAISMEVGGKTRFRHKGEFHALPYGKQGLRHR